MGQSTSAQEMRFAALLNNYTEEIRCEFGTVLKHKQTFQRFLLREISLMDESEYSATLEKYQIKKNNIRENILNLTEVEGRVKTNFCSGSFKIFLIFEFSNISLCQEIKARAVEFRYFEEQDLWSIMQSCLHGIQEVNTETILLDPKKIFIMTDGLIKIIDPAIDNDGSKFLLEEEVYYAPQRYQNFSNCDRGSYSQKQTMFSLGMILLNSCILEECFDCYDEQNFSFNVSILEQKVDKLKTLYSEEISLIIQSILEIDPNKRLSMLQLQEAINKFLVPETQQWNDKQQQKQQHQSIERKQQTIEQQSSKISSLQQNNIKVKQKINQKKQKEEQKTNKNKNQIINQVLKNNNKQIIPNKITVSEIIDKDLIIKEINSLRQYNRCLDQTGTSRRLLRHQKTQSENIVKIGNNDKNYHTTNLSVNENNFYTFNNQQMKNNLNSKIQNNSNYNQHNHHQSTNFPTGDNYYSFQKGPETYCQENISDRTFENHYKILADNQKLLTNPKLLEICRKDLEQFSQRKSFQQSSFKSQTYRVSEQPFKESIIKNITNTNQQDRHNSSTSSNVSPAALLKKPAKSFFNPIYTNSSQKPEAQFIIEIYEDGRKYEGNIVNGFKQGNGKLIYPDGAYYQGNFFNNKMQGYGILYYKTGRPAYQGYWSEDQFHGNGILYNENPIRLDGSFDFQDFNQVQDFWSRYQGNFEYDNKCGNGKLFLANGEYFQGQFDQDCINGRGQFHDIHRVVHYGIWRDNIFQYYL